MPWDFKTSHMWPVGAPWDIKVWGWINWHSPPLSGANENSYMRGEMCSSPSNKSSFLWLLHISLSLALSLSLSLLSSLRPLTLSHWWAPGGMHICVAHFCLFSCLCANICTPSRNNKVDLHIPSCPIYLMQRDIYDILPTVTSGSITYLQCALSSEYPLMAHWIHACDLAAEDSIDFTPVFQFSLSSLVVHTATTFSHCRCLKGRRSHPPRAYSCESMASSFSSSVHCATHFSQINNFTRTFWKKWVSWRIQTVVQTNMLL